MTSYEVIKELAKREKKQGVALFANDSYTVEEIYYMMMDTPEDSDDATLLADDFETRMSDLCKDGWEYNRFMRVLLPEEKLVQWG